MRRASLSSVSYFVEFQIHSFVYIRINTFLKVRSNFVKIPIKQINLNNFDQINICLSIPRNKYSFKCNNPPTHPSTHPVPSNTKVNIPIMMSVINEVYGQKIVSTSSSFSSSSSSSSLLPLQQLLLLCTLLLTSKRVSSKEVLIGKVCFWCCLCVF